MSGPKYILSIDKDQLDSIIRACEKVARIELSQLDVLQDMVPNLDFQRAQELKLELFPDLEYPGESLSIRSDELPDRVRQLYDIFHTFTHFLLTKEDSPRERYSVYESLPAHLSTKCDLPEIQAKNAD